MQSARPLRATLAGGLLPFFSAWGLCAWALSAPASSAATETTLYSFKNIGADDGVYPAARLIYFDRAFYGATLTGGVPSNGGSTARCSG